MNWKALQYQKTLMKSKIKIQVLMHDQNSGRKFLLSAYNIDKISDVHFASLKNRVEAAGQLNHPNIQKVYGHSKKGNIYYVLSEHMEGVRLESYLKYYGAVDEVWGLRFIHQLGDALDAAHEKGIVHGWLNGRKIFMKDNTPKITGFDQLATVEYMACSREEYETDMLYSSFYLPPEIIQEKLPLTSSDQYSLACIYYEALTGLNLFKANYVLEILNRKFKGYNSLNLLDAAKQMVLGVALNPEPSRRFASIKDFLNALSVPNLSEQSFYGGVPVENQNRFV